MTNNNQLLLQLCIRGIEGEYHTLIEWYQNMAKFVNHLQKLIRAEIIPDLDSRDQKTVQKGQMNFLKIFLTLSCGCFSKSEKLVRACWEFLQKMVNMYIDSEALKLQTLKILLDSSDSGACYAINYGL